MLIIFPHVSGAIIMLCCGAIVAALPSDSPANYLEDRAITPYKAIPDLPDDDFSFVIEWYKVPLIEIPSIMVCVWAMRELALLHFEDEFVPQRDWIHPRFPQVRLTVIPPAGKDDLSVRFALWIITAAAPLLLESERIQEIRFLGYFRNRAIGSVRLTPSSAIDVLYNSTLQHRSSPENEQPPGTQVAFAFGNVSMKYNALFSSNDQLHADVKYLNFVIDWRDIFLGVTWFLLDCAPHNKEPLTVWRVVRQTVLSEITTVWNYVRQTQCQMTMGDVISFLAYLPEVLLQQQMFREMDIVITDDGVVVARGSFRARTISRLMEPSLSMTLNVTTS